MRKLQVWSNINSTEPCVPNVPLHLLKTSNIGNSSIIVVSIKGAVVACSNQLYLYQLLFLSRSTFSLGILAAFDSG
jgi:hypothetical protein